MGAVKQDRWVAGNDLEPARPGDPREAAAHGREVDLGQVRGRDQGRDHSGQDQASQALDLSTMNPYDFERLIRDLFLAMGFTAWRTPDSRDGGVDAVAVRDDIAIGGVCVIQAKRYTHTVPVEAVRALYGTMQAQKAYTGLVVTTSAFGPASYAFAAEVGRNTLIDGPRLRALIKEHLGRDTVISPRRTTP